MRADHATGLAGQCLIARPSAARAYTRATRMAELRKTVLVVDKRRGERASPWWRAAPRLPGAARRHRRERPSRCAGRGRGRDAPRRAPARHRRLRRPEHHQGELPAHRGRGGRPTVQELGVAIEAMRHGAFHYMAKDLERRRRPACWWPTPCERQNLNRSVLRLNAEVAEQDDREFIVGPSRATREVVELVQKVARLPATVLILGESGTGKELLARLLHRQSGDPGAPFVAVNLAAIPQRAGREHAVRPREGIVHRRHPPADRQVRAGVGRHAVPRRDRRPAHRAAGEAAARDSGERDRARRRHPSDQDQLPPDRRHQRRSRKRGAGGPVPRGSLLPPPHHPDPHAGAARAHRGPAGARQLLPAALQREASARTCEGIAETALETLKGYWWPGNIRELENLIERLVAVSDKAWITDEDLPVRVPRRTARRRRHRPARTCSIARWRPSSATSSCARSTRHDWNITATARALGIPLSTLKSKMRRLEHPRDRAPHPRRLAARLTVERRPVQKTPGATVRRRAAKGSTRRG